MGRVVVAMACLVAAFPGSAAAQDMQGCFITSFEPGTMIPDYDCEYQHSGPRPPAFAGTWYAAIAKSAGTVAWGASWHETSQESANRSAMQSCAKSGQKDCKIAITGANNCLSLAISKADGAWGTAPSDLDRGDAISKATNVCKKYGGRDCSVVVTPCGRNSPTTPPCLKTYPIDISKGEVWKKMTPEERAGWNKHANGTCY